MATSNFLTEQPTLLTKGWLTVDVRVPSLRTCVLTCDRVQGAVDLVMLLHTRRFSFILSWYRPQGPTPLLFDPNWFNRMGGNAAETVAEQMSIYYIKGFINVLWKLIIPRLSRYHSHFLVFSCLPKTLGCRNSKNDWCSISHHPASLCCSLNLSCFSL